MRFSMGAFMKWFKAFMGGSVSPTTFMLIWVQVFAYDMRFLNRVYFFGRKCWHRTSRYANTLNMLDIVVQWVATVTHMHISDMFITFITHSPTSHDTMRWYKTDTKPCSESSKYSVQWSNFGVEHGNAWSVWMCVWWINVKSSQLVVVIWKPH